MNTSRIMKTVCAVGLTAACAWGLAGCSENATASDEGDGSVAATVNGNPIYENQVTNYIQGMRETYGMTDDESWGTSLAQAGMTPESFREDVINQYAEGELILQGADEAGIVVEAADIDGYVDAMKANYGDDAQWQAALESAGLTEERYRSEIERQLKSQRFMETFIPAEDPSEEDMLPWAQMYASSYDGAKRSSHILFNSDDEATAKEVLAKIKSGQLDFAEAAKEYSQDGSAANGGDVGWDKGNMSGFVEPYQTALDDLKVGEVSGLVTSDYGIHIIKCTDEFKATKTTDEDGNETLTVESVSQLPDEWVEQIKASVKQTQQSSAYQEWLAEATESADIVINPMPANVPYNVDMSKYESEAEQHAIDENAGVSDEPEEENVTDNITVEGEGETPADNADDAEGGEGDEGENGDADSSDK